jgi:hypothetical protein
MPQPDTAFPAIKDAADFRSRCSVDPTTECWLWQGRFREAFGQQREAVCTFRGKQQLAQRVAYRLFVGQEPPGTQIRHTCKQQVLCCNPDHLYAGPPIVTAKR